MSQRLEVNIREGLHKLEELLVNCRLNEGYIVLSHEGFRVYADLSDLPSKSNRLWWRFDLERVRKPFVATKDILKSLQA